MSFKKMLSGSYVLLACLCLMVALLAVQALNSSAAAFSLYVEGIAQRSSTMAQVGSAMKDRAIAARNLLLASEPAALKTHAEAAAHAHQDVVRLLAHYNQLVTKSADMSERARALAAEINQIEASYAPVALSIVDMAAKGERDAAIAKMNGECIPLLGRLDTVQAAYLDVTRTANARRVATMTSDFERNRILLIGIAGLALLGSGVVGGFMIRRMLGALGAEPVDLGQCAARIADGDLSPLPGARQAPAHSVMASMSRMQDHLVNIIGEVKRAAEQIATASGQITSGSRDLSGRTEQQAGALQETAATMEQLGSTVRHNADSSLQANQLARGASELAERGGVVVKDVVQTMRGINDSSRKIGDIIAVIDGIAFQTNILALNAAVEAARAGEQGRGFAVVAGEVRILARRSADAAREIKELINASVEQMHLGTSQADAAGTTMNDIVRSIQRVSDIVGEISTASVQQSSGVAQVGQAVMLLDRNTQQNAALVEESTAAAASLQRQAVGLSQLMDRFRLHTA